MFGNYYGNYQPNFYQPPMPDTLAQLRGQQMQPQMPPQQQGSNGLLWVQGEAGAKAYPVAPGGSVALMDVEGNTFYVKSVDNTGMPRMRVFDYVERLQAQSPGTSAKPNPGTEYVTRQEFEALAQKLAPLWEEKEE